MSTAADTEIPFHFGAGGNLFGMYHPAAKPATQAMLLCAPFGQDQIRTHRLYRQLAQSLAAAGTPVLRFDYYGSGDSAGDSIQRDFDQCIDDTVTAANELRARSGCERLLAFGARLGGNIALASAARARFGGVMLWDPIFDGAAHVARLDEMQQSLKDDRMRFLKSRPAAAVAGQWQGFAVSDALRQRIGKLRLEAGAVPTVLLDSLDTSDTRGIKTVMLPNTPWDDPDRLELAILSHELIQAVSSQLREAW
jgi:uncharacterized protein